LALHRTDPTIAAKLTPAGESAWHEFRCHVEWAESFALIFLFASARGPIDIFRDRLDNILRSRVSRLWHIPPSSSEEYVDTVMGVLRQPSEELLLFQAPLWIDISSQGNAWEKVRFALLQRLNEHRELFRRQIPRPVVLVLPGSWREQVRNLAPDLWSIRAYSLNLDETGAGEVPYVAEQPTSGAAPYAFSDEQLLVAETHLREWRRIQKYAQVDRNTLVAGWRALKAVMILNNVRDGEKIAGQVLTLARRMAANKKDTTLRDLSVSLDNVGQVARAQGRLEEAQAAYGESLSILRRLAAAFPENEDYCALLSSVQKRLDEESD
jgi:hypothetical protein